MKEVVKTIPNVKIVNNNVSDLKIKIQMLNEIIEKKDIKLFFRLYDKICKQFDIIYDEIKISTSDKEEIAYSIENIYKNIISLNKQIQKLSKRPYMVSNDKRKLDNVLKKCVLVLVKLGYEEKLEILDIYNILKVIIFEEKNLDILKNLFDEIPALSTFEENILIVKKVFKKYIIHLTDDYIKAKYYKDVLEYLLKVKKINIPKEYKYEMIEQIKNKKCEIKNLDIDEELKSDSLLLISSFLSNLSIKKKSIKELDLSNLKEKYGITSEFNKQILHDADNIIPYTNKSYIDVRDKFTISIDCKNTRSIDDAFSFEKTDNGYILEVYISDVDAYIKMNSNFDREAYNRTNSIILPKNYISMFPPRLADITFSLIQGQTRYAVCHRFEFSSNMDFINYNIYNAIINVNKNYNYDQVDKILNDNKNSVYKEYFFNVLEFDEKLNDSYIFNSEYYDIKQIKRSINSELISSKQSQISSISSKIIRDFMVLTNYFEARLFNEMQLPFLYSVNKSTNNKQIINQIKLSAEKTENISTILKMIKENFSSSYYSTTNEGHQGLGMEFYCKATNPIRNYASLTIQRLEHDFIFNEIDDRLIYIWEDYLEDLVKHLNDKKNNIKGYCKEYYKSSAKK